MLKCLKNADWKKTGIFAAGVAFGTAGITQMLLQRYFVQKSALCRR